MDQIWIAIVAALSVAVPTVLTTTFLPIWTKRQENKVRRQERAEDREALQEAARRTEQVAVQAKEAAALLADNTAKQALQASSLAEKVDEVKAVSNVIHTLVNSKLTITTQKLRDRTASSLALLCKFSSESVVEIRALEVELSEIDAELSDRAVEAKSVEMEVAH